METKIILVGYRHDDHTGHVSVTVKSVTTDGNASWEGPERVYGVDSVAFVHRFNSDPEQFEAWVAGQHKQYLGAHNELTEHLKSRKGKVIG